MFLEKLVDFLRRIFLQNNTFSAEIFRSVDFCVLECVKATVFGTLHSRGYSTRRCLNVKGNAVFRSVRIDFSIDNWVGSSSNLNRFSGQLRAWLITVKAGRGYLHHNNALTGFHSIIQFVDVAIAVSVHDRICVQCTHFNKRSKFPFNITVLVFFYAFSGIIVSPFNVFLHEVGENIAFQYILLSAILNSTFSHDLYTIVCTDDFAFNFCIVHLITKGFQCATLNRVQIFLIDTGLLNDTMFLCQSMQGICTADFVQILCCKSSATIFDNKRFIITDCLHEAVELLLKIFLA